MRRRTPARKREYLCVRPPLVRLSIVEHEHSTRKPRVGLFVTCLVDLMRPSVGFAAVKLLEDAGCIVEVPVQTCCGQPAYNSGDRSTTPRDRRAHDHGLSRLRLRGRAVRLLRRHDQGALSGAVRRRSRTGCRAPTSSPRKTYELTSFLVDVLGVTTRGGSLRRRGHLSRFLLGPARARRPQPAAQAARQRSRA